jgi:hypothetical protein
VKRFIVIAALAIAGCGQQAQEPQGDAAEVASTIGLDASIGPSGAAGISAALPMNVDAVAAAASAYAVDEVDDQIEGNPFKAITLSAAGSEVFRVLPTADNAHIHAIVTRSPQARGPAGEIIGTTLFGVAPPAQVSFCLSELVDGAQGFACSDSQAGTFWRVYKLPEGASDVGSFEEIEPDLLHDATLAEMRWIAPRV